MSLLQTNMRKIFIALGLLFFTSASSFAQNGMTYLVQLNNSASVSQNIEALAQAETNFWKSHFDLDSTMTSKLHNNNYSIYMQYIHAMKTQNYMMEKVLLEQQYSFKVRRTRFMEMFLSANDFATYKKIVAEKAAERMAAYKDKPMTEEIGLLRPTGAGWNVVGHTINFK